MINIELGKTYGLGSFEEAVEAIETLRRRGFSDEEINGILKRSPEPGLRYFVDKNGYILSLSESLPEGVIVPGKRIPSSCDRCFCCHKSSLTGETFCFAGRDPAILIDKSGRWHIVDCPLIEVVGGAEP